MTQMEKIITKAAKILDEKHPELADKKRVGYLVAGQVVFPIGSESDKGLIGSSKPDAYIVNPLFKHVKPWKMNPTLIHNIGRAILKNRYVAFDSDVEAYILEWKKDMKDVSEDEDDNE